MRRIAAPRQLKIGTNGPVADARSLYGDGSADQREARHSETRIGRACANRPEGGPGRAAAEKDPAWICERNSLRLRKLL